MPAGLKKAIDRALSQVVDYRPGAAGLFSKASRPRDESMRVLVSTMTNDEVAGAVALVANYIAERRASPKK